MTPEEKRHLGAVGGCIGFCGMFLFLGQLWCWATGGYHSPKVGWAWAATNGFVVLVGVVMICVATEP